MPYIGIMSLCIIILVVSSTIELIEQVDYYVTSSYQLHNIKATVKSYHQIKEDLYCVSISYTNNTKHEKSCLLHKRNKNTLYENTLESFEKDYPINTEITVRLNVHNYCKIPYEDVIIYNFHRYVGLCSLIIIICCVWKLTNDEIQQKKIKDHKNYIKKITVELKKLQNIKYGDEDNTRDKLKHTKETFFNV